MTSTSGPGGYLLPFNRHYVRYLVGQIIVGHGRRGVVLEKLVAYLIRTVAGLALVSRRRHVKGGEVDILVVNKGSLGYPLRWLGDYFLVECKDRAGRVSERDFGHFLAKLAFCRTKQGLIVSKAGLSGSPGYKYASRSQKLAFSGMGFVILEIGVDEIKRLGSAQDLLDLLQKKYEKLRFS